MGTTAEELRQRLEEQRTDLGTDLEAIGDRVSPGRIVERRKEAARDRVAGVRDRLMGARDQAGSIGAAPAAIGDKVSTTAAHVGEQITGAPDSAKRAAQGNPLAMGLIAFGAGLVVASLLPESEAERRAVAQIQPALEHAAADAGDAVREVIEEVRPMAEDAARELKESAVGAAESVKSSAGEAASGATDAAKQAVDDVRST